MSGLHLPHWKVEAFVSCTPRANARLNDSVYQMFLNRTSALGDVPVHNGINGRIIQTHLLNVDWWGTQNWPRVELLGTFCVWLPGIEKARGMGFILGEPSK